jgi:glycosyltransferase involved in cell wall biosynthesis
MNSLVSIVMPVYNGEKYIKEALNSVLAQSYPYWELVIIDDGSTDTTAEIITNINDSRVRYIFQENRGQAFALNHGLEEIKGDYYCSLDADDCMPVDSLHSRVTYLNNHSECGAVHADGYFCDENMNPGMAYTHGGAQKSSGDIYGDLINATLFANGTVMIRCDIIRENHLRYDESIVWCQDLDFDIRVAEICDFGYVDYPCQMYRVHSDNMTVSMPTGRRLDSLIRTKFKVLSASKFTSVASEKKFKYFYEFFVKDLHNRLDDQKQILNNEHFLELPQESRAQLLRYSASRYLSEGKNLPVANKYLRLSKINNPFDIKTRLLIILISIHPDFARWILGKRKMNFSQMEYLPFSKS